MLVAHTTLLEISCNGSNVSFQNNVDLLMIWRLKTLGFPGKVWFGSRDLDMNRLSMCSPVSSHFASSLAVRAV